MAIEHWLSYFGAFTGTAGLVLGYLGYRRSGAIKTLDLRLELRRAESDLRADIQALPALLESSKQSRTNVNAARGILRTGAFEKWKSTWNDDMTVVQTLLHQLPELSEYRRASQKVLEARLIEVHALSSRVAKLRNKYMAELSDDDRERDHIREDMRMQTHAKLTERR